MLEKREKKKHYHGQDEHSNDSEDQDEKLDIIYEKIEMDAQKLIAKKIPEIQKECLSIFDHQVKLKLDSIKEQ